MTTRKNWADLEIAACIRLYFKMRACVDTGRAYNKAQMIRDAQASVLPQRSRGSIEAKLMNISAVLIDINCENISMINHGYKPASNYQKLLKDMTVSILQDIKTRGAA